MSENLRQEYMEAVDDHISPFCTDSIRINFNERNDFGRFFIEILLYFSIVSRAFGHQLGILRIPRLSGLIIVISGVACFSIMLLKRQKIPLSFYFALGINIMANFSQVFAVGQKPILGDFLRDLLFWMSFLLMTCYVVRNDNASKRAIIIFGLMAAAAVWIGGGVARAGTIGARVERLELEDVGSMFANANDLAYLVANIAILALFASLSSKKIFVPIYWMLAMLMVWIMLRTVSRGALMFFVVSMLFFAISVLLGKGGKIGFIFLIILILLAASRVAYQLSQTREAYRTRAMLYSGRLNVWRGVSRDIPRTLFTGRGPARAFTTSEQVEPHNTFLWLHLAYGGVCAWIYFAWIALISIRGLRLLSSGEVSMRQKLMVFGIFFIAMACQMLTNFGPVNYGVILSMAMVEKYTTPFSKKAILLRKAIY